MFSKKEHPYPVSDSPVLRRLLRRPVFALFIHWVFQGMLYMERTELIFKLGVEVVITTLFLMMFRLLGSLSILAAVVMSLLLAHTVNFLFNGQVWVVINDFGLMERTQEAYNAYLCRISEDIRAEASIAFAAAYGSLSRGQWTSSSDLDIRVVRKAGVVNGLRACAFVMVQRARAFIARFPLDIYVQDAMTPGHPLSKEESPIVIKSEA